MSETKTVVVSMKVGNSAVETLNLPIGIDIMDVKILEIQKFDVINWGSVWRMGTMLLK